MRRESCKNGEHKDEDEDEDEHEDEGRGGGKGWEDGEERDGGDEREDR